MTGTGVPDPGNPDQRQVPPRSVSLDFVKVMRRFQLANLCLPQNTSAANRLAHCYGYLLGQMNRYATRYQEPRVAGYGDDPQSGEDQHVHVIHRRDGTLPPVP